MQISLISIKKFRLRFLAILTFFFLLKNIELNFFKNKLYSALKVMEHKFIDRKGVEQIALYKIK